VLLYLLSVFFQQLLLKTEFSRFNLGQSQVGSYCRRESFVVTTKRVQIALTLRIVACGTKLALCPAGFIVFHQLFRKNPFYLVDLRQELFFSKAYVFCDHFPLNSTLLN
jgi:hypothetical protein